MVLIRIDQDSKPNLYTIMKVSVQVLLFYPPLPNLKIILDMESNLYSDP